MSTSLYGKTPSVTVLDNRGLTVRDIAYHRHPDTPDVTSERITRHQNIAPLQGERHGSAVPMVFMTSSRFYTLRYVNFRRISLACRATNLRENVNSINQENPAGLLLTGVSRTDAIRNVSWSPHLLSTAMSPHMSSFMTAPKKPYSTAPTWVLSSFLTR